MNVSWINYEGRAVLVTPRGTITSLHLNLVFLEADLELDHFLKPNNFLHLTHDDKVKAEQRQPVQKLKSNPDSLTVDHHGTGTRALRLHQRARAARM